MKKQMVRVVNSDPSQPEAALRYIGQCVEVFMGTAEATGGLAVLAVASDGQNLFVVPSYDNKVAFLSAHNIGG